jgi:cytochrome c553
MPRSRIVLLLLTSLFAGGAGRLQAADPQPFKVPDTLEQRVLACAICHGKQGEGIRKREYYPRLAGKPAGYLYNQLVNFSERRRESPIMTYMVGYLSDPYLREIAEYYSELRPPYPPPVSRASKEALARGEALVTQGDPSKKIPACAACHGKALTGMEPAIPGLVGLYPDYIVAQLGAWKGGHRHAQTPDCMKEIASGLSPEDISAAAAWLAAQTASVDTPAAPAKSLKLPMECGGVPK